MPIYEYECAACSRRHEVMQKISDGPLVECPECGAPQLKRLISVVGFRLSGGGWYETDFKSDRRRNVAEKDSTEKKPKENGKDKKDTAPSKQTGTGDAGKTAKSGQGGAGKAAGTASADS